MNLLDMLDGQLPAEELICSRRGCRTVATSRLLWNNPKIHPPERRKVWLACNEHNQWLEDYLRTRGLWCETLPVPVLPTPSGAHSDSTETH